MTALAITLLFLCSGYFALIVITSMLAEYRNRIIAALIFAPMPPCERFRVGQQGGGQK